MNDLCPFISPNFLPYCGADFGYLVFILNVVH